ncbi:hypothetical protein ERO13_A09G198700v2 [Gossypium hirsutum]|uniref:Beta-amyrin 11-oxidase isoform X2 n=1 Tax=Gossypium hirsutum TaxID=3635 RepID=A0A1U8IGH9_GOSHI|nr:beta-amyrin 11-oxidase isoform X2 [Gossypium hirsutum]KAG4184888.1 hypothetical protein ERO13_A09G198700v2 [Gossypium hirsutum]
MELDLWSIAIIVVTFVVSFGFLKKAYERLGQQQLKSLPPGDMGWPLIGNTWSFIRAYKSQNPESFINNLKKRYGKTGIYKTHLFGKASILVCSAELCKKVLTDDNNFQWGYPVSNLIQGDVPFDYMSSHRRLHRLVTTVLNQHQPPSSHLGTIEKIVINTLEEWSKMKEPILFVPEVNKFVFKLIIAIFLGSGTDDNQIASMEEYYRKVYYGLHTTPINIPGFAYHRAVQARKVLVNKIRGVLGERRERRCNDPDPNTGIIDFLEKADYEDSRPMSHEHLVVLLIGLFIAGRETTSRTAIWATIYLHNHPHLLHKAKEEQEEIVKRRPSSQKGLTFTEIKQMKYLSKVINETLRIRTNNFSIFREAKNVTYLNGYQIPQGWKVLVWTSAVHMDPEIYPNPNQFLPSRWDDFIPKAGAFLPFSTGSSTCPGADLAKLEVTIFLHYFLLNYKLVQLNPGGPVNYFPSPDPVDNCPAKIIKIR